MSHQPRQGQPRRRGASRPHAPAPHRPFPSREGRPLRPLLPRRALHPPCDRPWRSSRSEEHTSELQSRLHLVCRLLLEKKKINMYGKHQPSLRRKIRPLTELSKHADAAIEADTSSHEYITQLTSRN